MVMKPDWWRPAGAAIMKPPSMMAERERAEEKLRRSEAYLAEAQRLSHTGSFGWAVSSGKVFWSDETFRILQYERTTKPSVELVLQRTHPEDMALVKQTIECASQDGKDFDFGHRLLMPDGSIKHVRVVGHAERDQSGELEFVGAVMDLTAAKEAEERIRQNEMELRITVETIPAIVSSTLPDGSVDFVSQSWLDYLGRSREEILGGAWKSVIHPEDLDRVLNNWQAALAAGEPLEMERRHRRADGKYRWFLVRAVPLRDEMGNIVKWYATHVDIEERKQAEEKLRMSEAYLAEAQRLSHTGSFGWAVSSGEILWSDETFQIFEYDPATKPTVELILQRTHPEDRALVKQTIERASQDGQDFDFEHRLLMPDGSIKQLRVLGHAERDKLGEREFVGAVMDVTAAKGAEDRIRRNERELRITIETIPAFVVITLADGSVDFVSQSWLNYVGCSTEEMLDWGWMKITHPEDLDRVVNNWQAVLVSGEPLEIEVRIRREDGNYRWFLARAVPLRDGKGNVAKWYTTVTDIEDRKQAEEKLRRSEAYLAEAQKLTQTGSWAVNVATGEPSHSSAEHSRLFGFDPERGLPSREELLQRIHPEDLDRVVETYDRAVGERADVEVDFRTVLPNGTMKYIHSIGHPVFNAAGDPVEFVGTVMDVTERRRAEEERRASEQVARGQAEALAQSLDVLATAPEPEKFIGQMLNTIGRLLNAQSVALWLFDESTDSFVWRLMADGGKLVPSNPEHPFVKNPLVWKQNPAIQEMLFTGGPIVCEDVQTDPRVTVELRDHFKKIGTKRFLGVPISIGGKVRGFIGVRHTDQASYRREEIELTQALAHQVMLALQLNELAEQNRRAAILEERNRMARDIHDTLAQGFTGVIMQLEAAEEAIARRRPKLVDEYLRRAGKLARQSLNEARRSVHALRPEALKESSFWDALKEMIKSITVGTALHPSFKAQGKVDQLPPVWQENLLHIGQEALANTIKYAHAHKFGTRLIYDPKELRLEFSDDGDGFKPQDRHDGSGLAGMRERVEQMGGELKITSARGKGTKITVVLPSNGESML